MALWKTKLLFIKTRKSEEEFLISSLAQKREKTNKRKRHTFYNDSAYYLLQLITQ